MTRKDSYPSPHVDNALEAMAGIKVVLNTGPKKWLLAGQAEYAKEKTALSAERGLCMVMPFGLCNAPATFKRLMELVLAGLPW